jgi:hypothetical protein
MDEHTKGFGFGCLSSVKWTDLCVINCHDGTRGFSDLDIRSSTYSQCQRANRSDGTNTVLQKGLREFLHRRHDNWMAWFTTGASKRLRQPGSGLEVIADFLGEWFDDPESETPE